MFLNSCSRRWLLSASVTPPGDSIQKTESRSNISLHPSSKRITWSRKGRRLKQGSLRPNLSDTDRRRTAASWRGSEVWNERGSTAWWSSDRPICEGFKCLWTFLKDTRAVDVIRWLLIAASPLGSLGKEAVEPWYPFWWIDDIGEWNLWEESGVVDKPGRMFVPLPCTVKDTLTGLGMGEHVSGVV